MIKDLRELQRGTPKYYKELTGVYDDILKLANETGQELGNNEQFLTDILNFENDDDPIIPTRRVNNAFNKDIDTVKELRWAVKQVIQ